MEMKRIVKATSLLVLGIAFGAIGAALGLKWFSSLFVSKWPTRVESSQITDCAWRCFMEGRLEYAYAMAEKGDESAAPIQYIKGYCHELKNELGSAADFYRMAANQGFTAAMWRLACCYRDGRGVVTDGKQAVRWAERAGEDGCVEAMLMVAKAYSGGALVPRDTSKALYWWERAAEKNNAEAQYRLGYAYEVACGVNRDIDEAAKWYDRARINGHSEAAAGLARMRQAKRLEHWTRFKEHLRMLFV